MPCTSQEEWEEEDGQAAAEDSAADEATADEEELLAAAVDCLPALAVGLGPETYAPIFAEHHAAPLLGRLKQQQAEGVRALASGALAEVSEVLGRALPGAVAEAAMPLLLRELRGEVCAAGCRVVRGWVHSCLLFINSPVGQTS